MSLLPVYWCENYALRKSFLDDSFLKSGQTPPDQREDVATLAALEHTAAHTCGAAVAFLTYQGIRDADSNLGAGIVAATAGTLTLYSLINPHMPDIYEEKPGDPPELKKIKARNRETYNQAARYTAVYPLAGVVTGLSARLADKLDKSWIGETAVLATAVGGLAIGIPEDDRSNTPRIMGPIMIVGAHTNLALLGEDWEFQLATFGVAMGAAIFYEVNDRPVQAAFLESGAATTTSFSVRQTAFGKTTLGTTALVTGNLANAGVAAFHFVKGANAEGVGETREQTIAGALGAVATTGTLVAIGVMGDEESNSPLPPTTASDALTPKVTNIQIGSMGLGTSAALYVGGTF